jgi:hypothetical protein
VIRGRKRIGLYLIFQFFEGSDLLNQLFSATAGAEDFEVSSASDEDKFKTNEDSSESVTEVDVLVVLLLRPLFPRSTFK